MTQENKELLIKDISARLPYGIIVECNDNDGSLPNTWEVVYINIYTEDVYLLNTKTNATKLISIEDIKPCLYPLSSMTEEQKKEFPGEVSILNAFIDGSIYLSEDEKLTSENLIEIFDFLNKNHFDYRGLIEKGLALDATGLDIY